MRTARLLLSLHRRHLLGRVGALSIRGARNRHSRGCHRRAPPPVPEGVRACGRAAALRRVRHPAGVLAADHRIMASVRGRRRGHRGCLVAVRPVRSGMGGCGPPKLLEYNADTPTALLEASVVQWQWLREVAPTADQFNSIHEKLIARWRTLRTTAF